MKIILVFLICACAQFYAFAEDNVITVFCGREKAQISQGTMVWPPLAKAINKKVFGNNSLGYDTALEYPAKAHYYGHSDFGAGIWDSKWNELVKEVIDLAKEAGITVLRFPGGCGTHHYNWKDAAGKKREHFLYGVDEFLKTCGEIGAEPVFTVSYFEGDEQDAADLVKYTKARIKYFEIGNEDWHGDHRDIKQVLPQDYAERYLKYYEAMKAADPSIMIGVILYNDDWDEKVMAVIKDKLDFGIVHIYPTPAWGENLSRFAAREIFGITLALPEAKYRIILKDTLDVLEKYSGRKIPLAVTEFNAGFVQQEPVPYRHTLLCALVNAELLKIFLRPENNILMANYWNFVNEYWGMIANGFNGKYETLNKPYYKRPNYYVFEMYHKHFGDILLDAEVKADGYDAAQYRPIKALFTKLKTGTLLKENLLGGNWKISAAEGVKAAEKDGILELEFLDRTYNYYHSQKQAQVEPNAYYKLSGYIKAENLTAEPGVCLEAQDARGWTKTRSAAGTERISGIGDWRYVEVVYDTLPDAKAVNVIARRVGEEGPLKGKAYFKDVRLEKFIPSIDTKIPYLSVNASKSADGKKIYLMVINKNMDESVTSVIELKDFIPAEEANAWILNGPAVDATNEVNHNNVKITKKEFKPVCLAGPRLRREASRQASPPAAARNDTSEEALRDSTTEENCIFEFTFQPHSLTAIEIEKRKES